MPAAHKPSNMSLIYYLLIIVLYLFPAGSRNLREDAASSSSSVKLSVELVEDIRLGSESSIVDPSSLTAFHDHVFFWTIDFDGAHRSSLYKSDGTAEGTVVVKDFKGFPYRTSQVRECNNELFFSGEDGELWKTDGTTNGTVRVGTDVTVGRGNFAVNGNRLFFTGRDERHGYELWVSDGTSNGTAMVKDINMGSESSSPRRLTPYSQGVFFQATSSYTYYSNELSVFELWASDGTASGTELVKRLNDCNINRFFEEAPFFVFDDQVYFMVDDCVSGDELWKSDGTSEGTVLVKDINPVANDSSRISWLTEYRGKFYFQAYDCEHGGELWSSDGTSEGTMLVKDINPGWYWSSPSYLTVFNGALFFKANDGVSGHELWKSDGTAEGTVLAKDVNPGPTSSYLSGLCVFASHLVFAARDGSSELMDGLWASDGTADGTVPLKGGLSGWESSFAKVGNELFFAAQGAGPDPDSGHGVELWKIIAQNVTMPMPSSRATRKCKPSCITLISLLVVSSLLLLPGGKSKRSLSDENYANGGKITVELVKDIHPGPWGSNPHGFTELNGNVFFWADDGTHGSELWKSDGTTEGTAFVKDINPGPAQYDHGYTMTLFKNELFFSSNDGIHGIELWKTNGTTEGTVLLSDIFVYQRGSSRPEELTVFNGELFFRANDWVHGIELWKTDGTSERTLLVTDINKKQEKYYGGTESSIPNGLITTKDWLFFEASGSPDTWDFELWRSDGTANGTSFIKGINITDCNKCSHGTTRPPIFAVLNNEVFFLTNGCQIGCSNRKGRELWKSDGTAEGTIMLKDFGVLNDIYSFGHEATAFNNELYFPADDGIHGEELWKTDGTRRGTIPVKELDYYGSSRRSHLTVFDGALYFVVGQRSLMKTDGSANGTVLIKRFRDYVSSLSVYQGELIIKEHDYGGLSESDQLWRSDGSERGTIGLQVLQDMVGDSFTEINGELFFNGHEVAPNPHQHGSELWKITRAQHTPPDCSADSASPKKVRGASLLSLLCLFILYRI